MCPWTLRAFGGSVSGLFTALLARLAAVNLSSTESEIRAQAYKGLDKLSSTGARFSPSRILDMPGSQPPLYVTA